MKKTIHLLTLFACLFLLTGCSEKVGLSGKVTYSDDGSPLETGQVCFTTDTYFSRGNIKENGVYTLGSDKETDGLPPGTYRVYVAYAAVENGVDKNGDAILVPLIDQKFADGKTSGITLTVDASTKNFDFKVDRFRKKK
ncbi:MAG: hypothetical protein LBN39_12665 [Planctomycetaceae bacterium]|nr:hypothetical protein [Planctomycetaceae bacterium]